MPNTWAVHPASVRRAPGRLQDQLQTLEATHRAGWRRTQVEFVRDFCSTRLGEDEDASRLGDA